jgi:hypothetical protein
MRVEHAGSEVLSYKVSNFEQTCAAQKAFDHPRGLQIPKLKYRAGLLDVKTEIPAYAVWHIADESRRRVSKCHPDDSTTRA